MIKTSKDAIIGLSTDCNVLTITKQNDDETKSINYSPQVNIEAEDMEKFGKYYPKVDEKLLRMFNKDVHNGSKSKVNAHFSEVNLEHRKTHPALDGEYKGKVAEFLPVEKTGKNADGSTYTYTKPEWVGGQPMYSQSALSQLKDLVTRVLQARKAGIPAKDIAQAIQKNGYVATDMTLSQSGFRVSGSRCKEIAKAKAKENKKEQDAKSGEAAMQNLNKGSEVAAVAS